MPSILPACAAALCALVLFSPAHSADTGQIDGGDLPPTIPLVPETPREPIPPAPAGFILDQAGVLLPEATARLSARLTTARASDVYVYVVTFRTLGVLPSKQEERLHFLAKDFAKSWAADKVGAMLLFDDEGGLMTVQFNPETDHRFATFAVEAALREPLGKIQQSGLARDKLEQSAYVIADTLIPLQEKWSKENHRQRIGNFIMGTIALLGIGLIIFSVLNKPKTPTAGAPGPAVKDEAPLDF